MRGGRRAEGGTQIEAHLLNAARSRQPTSSSQPSSSATLSCAHRVAISCGTVIALTPRPAPTHTHTPCLPLSRCLSVSVAACACAAGLRIIFGIIITMSPCFASSAFLLSPCPAVLQCWPVLCSAVLCCAVRRPGRRLSQFFCSSPSSHLLLAVFGTFPCGLQREIRFSYDQAEHRQRHHEHHHTTTVPPFCTSLPLLYYDYLRSCACRLPSCHGLSLASSGPSNGKHRTAITASHFPLSLSSVGGDLQRQRARERERERRIWLQVQVASPDA